MGSQVTCVLFQYILQKNYTSISNVFSSSFVCLSTWNKGRLLILEQVLISLPSLEFILQWSLITIEQKYNTNDFSHSLKSGSEPD